MFVLPDAFVSLTIFSTAGSHAALSYRYGQPGR